MNNHVFNTERQNTLSVFENAVPDRKRKREEGGECRNQKKETSYFVLLSKSLTAVIVTFLFNVISYSQEEFPFEKLPKYVFAKVVSSLPLTDIKNLSLTCKKNREKTIPILAKNSRLSIDFEDELRDEDLEKYPLASGIHMKQENEIPSDFKDGWNFIFPQSWHWAKRSEKSAGYLLNIFDKLRKKKNNIHRLIFDGGFLNEQSMQKLDEQLGANKITSLIIYSYSFVENVSFDALSSLTEIRFEKCHIDGYRMCLLLEKLPNSTLKIFNIQELTMDFSFGDFKYKIIDVLSQKIKRLNVLETLNLNKVFFNDVFFVPSVLGTDLGFNPKNERDKSFMSFMKAISDHPSIKNLSMNGWWMGAKTMTRFLTALAIKKSPIKRLSLRNCQIKDEHLKILSFFPSLDFLDIQCNDEIRWKAFKKFQAKVKKNNPSLKILA